MKKVIIFLILVNNITPQCGNGCKNCNTKTRDCTTCKDEYLSIRREDSTRRCVKCLPNCQACGEDDTCDTCIENHYYTSLGCNSCNSVTPGCGKCSQTVKCTECSKGFFMVGTGENVQCKNCLSYCETCNDETTCQKCFDGYFMEGNKCLQCTSGCKKCDNTETCETCMSGFFKLESKKCDSCLANCMKCSGKETCDECFDGFGVASDKKKCEEVAVNFRGVYFIGLIVLVFEGMINN